MKHIEFNKVTWYSKLAAVILFILLIPILTFYIGRKYEETYEIVANQPVEQIAGTKIPSASSVSTQEEKLKLFTSSRLPSTFGTHSNVVGYFARGNFSFYVPQWIVDHWKMENLPNGGMTFSPESTQPMDFSSIMIEVATTTERHNAETLYSEEQPVEKRKMCITGSRCDAPENDVSIVTSEILISSVSDTRIYHIARLVPYGRIQDSFYIDGRELTATIYFSAPQETYALYEPKIKEFVQGIGKGGAVQG